MISSNQQHDTFDSLSQGPLQDRIVAVTLLELVTFVERASTGMPSSRTLRGGTDLDLYPHESVMDLLVDSVNKKLLLVSITSGSTENKLQLA